MGDTQNNKYEYHDCRHNGTHSLTPFGNAKTRCTKCKYWRKKNNEKRNNDFILSNITAHAICARTHLQSFETLNLTLVISIVWFRYQCQLQHICCVDLEAHQQPVSVCCVCMNGLEEIRWIFMPFIQHVNHSVFSHFITTTTECCVPTFGFVSLFDSFHSLQFAFNKFNVTEEFSI